MKRLFPLSFFLMLVACLPAQPRFNGFLQNWTAYNLNGNNDLFLLRNRFQLNTTLSGDWARGYASVDFSDERQSDQPLQEIDIREMYVDLWFGKFDLRIGKQQVVWGKADGVFINDIVNPMDLRYFLMQDFADIRQGSGMVKANAYLCSWGLEALFIPKFEPYQFAEQGSPWEFFRLDDMTVPLQIDATTVLEIPIYFNWQDPQLPDNSIRNSEYGLKISGFALGADLSFLFLHSYQDNYISQVDSVIPVFDPASPYQVPQLLYLYLTPFYEKVNMYGFNFSRPVGGVVIRGEVGYFDDYYFIAHPEFTTEKLQALKLGMQPEISNRATSDYLQGVIGLDITGPWGSTLSTQYIRKQVLDYQSSMESSDEVSEMVTLLVSGTFWNETASAKSLTLYDRNNESGLSRLICGYEVADAVDLEFGVDILWGQAGSFIGQFAGNDNAYFKLTYSF